MATLSHLMGLFNGEIYASKASQILDKFATRMKKNEKEIEHESKFIPEQNL